MTRWALLLAGAAVVVPPAAAQQGNPGSLRLLAEQARARGVRQVDLGTILGCPPDVSSLTDAVRHYDLFVLQPIAAETVLENDRNLMTWYKARILKKVSNSPSSPLAPILAELPPRVLPHDVPANNQQILVIQNGGTITIDGVVITQRVVDFPALIPGKEYLCVLAISRDARVAIVPLGGQGVFEITGGDSLRAIGSIPHPLTKDVKARYGNSLSRITKLVRVRPVR
jgi:hypothetical protein